MQLSGDTIDLLMAVTDISDDLVRIVSIEVHRLTIVRSIMPRGLLSRREGDEGECNSGSTINLF